MESESFENISSLLRQINIEDEPGSEKHELYVYEPRTYKYVAKQKLPQKLEEYINFELYIKEKCENKIKILNRETFMQINRPILIFFNHFREKCAYLTKWLDRMYQLVLKYDDRIEFIAADMIDIDIMYPGGNPIRFFCRLVRPEDESPNIYAIDEKKRIYQHFDAYNTVEILSELCEKVITGNLFPSQPIPENNSTNLVKICVNDNYKELIAHSTKNVFLIINMDRYQEGEPNYENVALELKDYDLHIVYMEAEKNYIPFEYNANSYPTILFIPFNDKKNFIYYDHLRKEENVIEFLKNCLEKPKYLKSLQQQLRSRINYKTTKVPKDFLIDFDNLSDFLNDNYGNSIKVLDRFKVEKSKCLILIAFMNFQGKCTAEHVDWLNKYYQVAETCYGFEIYVGDFKDIDIINPKWKSEDIIILAQRKPKIYAFDRLKNSYKLGNFDYISSLFYFTFSVANGDFYYSEVYPRDMQKQLVKVWFANYFNIFLKKLKQHIFITFYSSDEDAEKLSNILELLAYEVQDLKVEVVKFDVKYNYVSLEYACDNYPVHYFIPKTNKRDHRVFVDGNLDKDKMLEFIKNNVKSSS